MSKYVALCVFYEDSTPSPALAVIATNYAYSIIPRVRVSSAVGRCSAPQLNAFAINVARCRCRSSGRVSRALRLCGKCVCRFVPNALRVSAYRPPSQLCSALYALCLLGPLRHLPAFASELSRSLHLSISALSRWPRCPAVTVPGAPCRPCPVPGGLACALPRIPYPLYPMIP
jgi:hypothetical protein